MGLEKPTTATLEQEHLDDAWFQEYQNACTFEELDLMTGSGESRKKQKEDFLNGNIENPTLDYPKLETFDFESKEQSLLDLKQKILAEEENEVVKQLYRWKLNERIAQLRALKATKDGDDRKFIRYSKFIYGSPEKRIYDFTLSQVKQEIDEKLFSLDPEISTAAQRLNTELFEALMDNESTLDPKVYDFPELKSDPNGKEYSAEEIKIAFEKSFQEMGLNGWTAEIRPAGQFSGIKVSQDKKSILIPEDRKLDIYMLQARIVHEIGTHAMRREKGERSKLRLLALGLDRYIKGEEGVSLYNEQLARGTSGFRGLDYHFAISLATGMDGKKRDFRKVFEILKDYYLIKLKKKETSAMDEAQNDAWKDCVRIFRGTSCKTPGACFTKDIVYREGNIGIWDVVKNNPEEVRRFSVGKYDPTNPRHIWILEQLGITDEDLADLET
jgi:hypothetical protein